MSEIDELKKQVSVLEQRLSLYENEELEKEGYYALKGLVKQQIEIIKDFKLKDEISKSPKDDKQYDRVKAIGEGLKGMITDLKSLKVELKISNEEDKKYNYRTTPESIAETLGDNKSTDV